jgi:5-methylcytosine-specific restriction enzyme subunit McrC
VSLSPSADDLQQVVAYAELKGTDHAILIYPVPVDLDTFWGATKHVRGFTFAIDGDLEAAGQAFLASLMDAHPTPPGRAAGLSAGRWMP